MYAHFSPIGYIVADPARRVARIPAICRMIAILNGIPRQSIDRIHYLRLSSCAGIRRRFDAIEPRFSVMPAIQRLAVVRDISYVVMAGWRA